MNELKNIPTLELKAIGFDLIQQIGFLQQQLTKVQSDLNMVYKELDGRQSTPPQTTPIKG